MCSGSATIPVSSLASTAVLSLGVPLSIQTRNKWSLATSVLRAAEGKHQPICEAVSVVALKFPWSRKDTHDDDPYRDFFLNMPSVHLINTVTELIRNAPAGNIFPTPADIHTPEITTQHVQDLARYCGAALVGIARLETNNTNDPDGYPFTVLLPCTPSTIRAYRRVLAARYRCKMACFLPSC